MSTTSPKSVLPLVFVSLFLSAHVVVPLVWGDVYPFTSAPMFRDQPERYCDYHVFAPDGSELPQEDWLVQRVYDGNPIGYGVGVKPPAVIEQQFGAVPEESEVREHISRQFSGHSLTTDKSPAYVEVLQETFGAYEGGSVQSTAERRWKITSPPR